MKTKRMAKVTDLLKIYDRLTESNRFAVLVHARLLVLRQVMVVQYHYEYRDERRRACRIKHPGAHWVY